MTQQPDKASSAQDANKDTAGSAEGAAAGGGEGGADSKQRLEGKVELSLLNEDDDFEEFPAEEWDETDPQTQTNRVWEDDWDDDMIEDDFSNELRAELQNLGFIKPTPGTTAAASSGQQPME